MRCTPRQPSEKFLSEAEELPKSLQSMLAVEAARNGRGLLLDPATLRSDFAGVAFADSHGAFDQYLGAGLLYYALSAMVRSQVSVCIGSGGGFVPSLMRRSQLDHGITPSTTILIDANLPDLAFGSPMQAGGWLTDENAFRERENDIVVLAMLSVDAGRFLARQNLRIDHLHIDGDHSAAGVLADYHVFAPLLSEQSVITLHDLRMPGVDEAIRTIRKADPSLEFLAFREVGAGTGVLRRALPRSTPRRSQTLADLADPTRRVELDMEARDKAAAESQEKAKFERWRYLTSDAFRVRYTIAADFIDHPGEAIIEIGGFPNSVAPYLRKARALHAVEPYLPRDFADAVTAEAGARNLDVVFHHGSVGALPLQVAFAAPYSVLALGLDLASACKTEADFRSAFTQLVSLVSGSHRTVIEVPRYRLSLLTLDHLLRILQPTIKLDIVLDLAKDPAGASYHVVDDRAVRRLIVCEPSRPIETEATDIVALIEQAASELAAAKAEATKPMEIDYHPGDIIDFRIGGNSERYRRGGWVAPERSHSWMQGHESWLHLRLPPDLVEQGEDFELRMVAKPFIVRGSLEQQTLIIRANGQEVGVLTLSGPGELQSIIPNALLDGAPFLKLSFIHPNAARPADLIAASKDMKLLAIAVSSLQIVPLGTDATAAGQMA